jgi:hypothetical protein
MTRTVIIGLLASAFAISSASAQGFLGERYAEVNGGYERLKVSDDGFSTTIDGWGAGAVFNLPLIQNPGQFGLDLTPAVDYIRGSESGVTLSVMQAGATFRGYMPLEQPIKPFAGVGANYTRVRASASGLGSESDSSVYIPAEAGVEFVFGALSLTPFFRYSFATDSDWDDFWTLGARAGFWFGAGWGAVATVSYSDFDDGFELLGIRAGLVFAW